MPSWPVRMPGWRRRHPVTTFLGLGSNLGDRLSNLQTAIRELDEHENVAVEAVSAVYETTPVTGDRPESDEARQEPYLNLVASVTTTLAPQELLQLAHRVEARHGRNREREARWGPRTIDIDILLYDDLTLDHPDLTIPHPRLTERAFVLVPLAEVMPPGARLPDDTTVTGHLARLAPITGVDFHVRLVEGPGTSAEPLRRRPGGPVGGAPRLGSMHAGGEQ
ncbi:MAG: 2-amino-4-hydroxy-6-hydroxymethyldihydropteridine diphosphokinase [Nitriliruptorales bacterium]